MLGHRTSHYKLKKTEIIPSSFSNRNIIKLEITNKENRKIHKYVEIKKHNFEQPLDQRKNQSRH